MPREANAGASSSAQRAALVGPSNSANTPSPVCLTRPPPYFASTLSTSLSCASSSMSPPRITTGTEQFCGADDVGEQHRLEHSFVDGDLGLPVTKSRIAEPSVSSSSPCGPGASALNSLREWQRPAPQRRRPEPFDRPDAPGGESGRGSNPERREHRSPRAPATATPPSSDWRLSVDTGRSSRGILVRRQSR